MPEHSESTDLLHTPLTPHQMQHPGGKDGMWVAGCACGYTTAPYPTREAAAKPLRAHLDAKNGAPR